MIKNNHILIKKITYSYSNYWHFLENRNFKQFDKLPNFSFTYKIKFEKHE